MNKLTLLSTLLFLTLVSAAVAYRMAAAFRWVETEHHFGQIQQGKPVTAEFKFINQGDSPLIVSNAYGSCGCTGVEYPREPLMPGAAGVIKATFNAAAVGAFHKTVAVESNAVGGLTTLHIKGEVVK